MTQESAQPRASAEEIGRAADANGKVEPSFVARILDAQGEVVCSVPERPQQLRERDG